MTTGGRLNAFQAASAVGGGSGLPPPWVAQDIGTVGAAGSAAAASGTFTVKGAGADIYGTADAFQFVWQPLSRRRADCRHVVSIQNTNAWSKWRDDAAESRPRGSIHAAVVAKPSSGLAFERRKTTMARRRRPRRRGSSRPPGSSSRERDDGHGFAVAGRHDVDGLGTDTVALGTPVDVGLVVTSTRPGPWRRRVRQRDRALDRRRPAADGDADRAGQQFDFTAPRPYRWRRRRATRMRATDRPCDVLANGSPIGSVTTPQAGVIHCSWMSVAAGSYTLTG